MSSPSGPVVQTPSPAISCSVSVGIQRPISIARPPSASFEAPGSPVFGGLRQAPGERRGGGDLSRREGAALLHPVAEGGEVRGPRGRARRLLRQVEALAELG